VAFSTKMFFGKNFKNLYSVNSTNFSTIWINNSPNFRFSQIFNNSNNNNNRNNNNNLMIKIK